VLVPKDFISLWIFLSRLPSVAITPIMQKIPMVMPNKERNVRSLFFHNSCRAILRLLKIISIERSINKFTGCGGGWGKNYLSGEMIILVNSLDGKQ
jgi:hypothetical protein